MPHLPHIAIVIGTRPEAIKMIPVIQEVSAANDLRLSIISTGQHREMLEQVLHLFALRPHIDLHLMAPDQTLSSLTEKALHGLTEYLSQARPDMLLVQGDTTTVLAAALAAVLPWNKGLAMWRPGCAVTTWPILFRRKPTDGLQAC